MQFTQHIHQEEQQIIEIFQINLRIEPKSTYQTELANFHIFFPSTAEHGNTIFVLLIKKHFKNNKI